MSQKYMQYARVLRIGTVKYLLYDVRRDVLIVLRWLGRSLTPIALSYYVQTYDTLDI